MRIFDGFLCVEDADRLPPFKSETPKNRENSRFWAGSDYTLHPKLAEIGMGTGNELVIATKGEDFKIPASFGYMLDIMSMTFKALSVFYNLFNKLFGFVGNIFA